jgi:hypothetical protein
MQCFICIVIARKKNMSASVTSDIDEGLFSRVSK